MKKKINEFFTYFHVFISKNTKICLLESEKKHPKNNDKTDQKKFAYA